MKTKPFTVDRLFVQKMARCGVAPAPDNTVSTKIVDITNVKPAVTTSRQSAVDVENKTKESAKFSRSKEKSTLKKSTGAAISSCHRRASSQPIYPSRSNSSSTCSTLAGESVMTQLTTESFEGYGDDISMFALSLGDSSSEISARQINLMASYSEDSADNEEDDDQLGYEVSFRANENQNILNSPALVTKRKTSPANRADILQKIEQGSSSATLIPMLQTVSSLSVATEGKRHREVISPNNGTTEQFKQMKSLERLQRGEFEEVFAFFESTLKQQISQHGEIHASVGTAMHNLGVARAKAQNNSKALKYFEEAVRIKKASLGETHWEVSTSLVKLGVVLTVVKEYDDADSAFREALRLRQSQVGGTSEGLWGVAQVLSHIGFLTFEMNEYFAAGSAFEEAILFQRTALKRKKEAPNEVESKRNLTTLANSLKNLGMVRMKRRQYQKASLLFDECLQIQLSLHKPTSPLVLDTVEHLATAHSKDGNVAKAIELFRGNHDKYEDLAGTDACLPCIQIQSKLILLYEHEKKFQEALKTARRVLAFQQRSGSPEMEVTRRILKRLERQQSQ